jgi:imidazolonepropionase-like amidohydrolase
VSEAERHNRAVMAHAHAARGIEAAARAGVSSIEHGWFLDESALHAMVEHDTWFVPTLSPALGSEDGPLCTRT